MRTPTTAGESTERPASLWKEILNLLDRSPAELLPFEEVRRRLKLRPGLFRGLRQIPLDRIIGSVGRYYDFDRAFLPHRADDRWQRINAAWQRGEQLPPIEVYQVGDVYFVEDGNHRVSVARANGASDIDAYVTAFHSPAPLEHDTDPDDLIVKQEQAEFLERTRLPVLRPKVTVLVPHYAMSGGTLISLAADEIVMDDNAVLGPVDPQLGQQAAASILKVMGRKDINAVDDSTIILADVAEKAIQQVMATMNGLLRQRMGAERAEQIATTLATGAWTHDYPINVGEARELGLPVSTEMPKEVYKLMGLYPQTAQRRPSVEYIPAPRSREADRQPARAGKSHLDGK